MTRSLSLAMSLLIGLFGMRNESAQAPAKEPVEAGTLPTDGQGRPLNLGFESGTLADWTAEGMRSRVSRSRGTRSTVAGETCTVGHAGRFWVGTYERGGDRAQGTLTSVPFRVTRPFASFLVGAGSRDGTAVELIKKQTGDVIFRASGDDLEDMERVVVDLSPSLGQEIMIRLVDRETAGWGHINFDDFRLHDARPDVPPRRRPATADVYQHAGLDPEAAARAMTVPPGLPRHPLRRRARRRPADRDGDRRPGPALGRRGVLVSPSRPRRPGTRPHPDLRGHRRRRPVRHAQGLRRPAEPRQRPGSSASAASGSARRLICSSSPTRTATTGPMARRRSCSTAGASTTRTRRSTPSPGGPTAGSTAATGCSPTRSSASPARRATGVHRSTPASGGTTRPGTSSRSSPTARATPGASTSTRAGR